MLALVPEAVWYKPALGHRITRGVTAMRVEAKKLSDYP
jgi:hypothetical protein